VTANPGLTRASIAVSCDAKRLTDVRVCVGKDLRYHECAEVTQRTCKRDQVSMPPPHAERAAELAH